MKNITKRDGRHVPFEADKIRIAVQKASDAADPADKIDKYEIAIITNEVSTQCDKIDYDASVEQVQDMVIDTLAEHKHYGLMRLYAEYRYQRALMRRSNTTDASILTLIQGDNLELNEENSNKSTVLASTQRDYIAGEVNRDITRRLMLPEKISKAHDEGAIHFHDADYFIQPIFNCFLRDTEFITDKGLMTFNDAENGQVVNVLCEDGEIRPATVHMYGMKPMQTVTFSTDNGANSITKDVVCTPDHGWILEDGTVTTNLKVGDVLETFKEYKNINSFKWRVISIAVYDNKKEHEAWCVEEPVTHTFTLAGGVITRNCCLVNIGDMLDNGTVMNGKMVESPHTFQVACTVTTQIIATVASNQYGLKYLPY